MTRFGALLMLDGKAVNPLRSKLNDVNAVVNKAVGKAPFNAFVDTFTKLKLVIALNRVDGKAPENALPLIAKDCSCDAPANELGTDPPKLFIDRSKTIRFVNVLKAVVANEPLNWFDPTDKTCKFANVNQFEGKAPVKPFDLNFNASKLGVLVNAGKAPDRLFSSNVTFVSCVHAVKLGKEPEKLFMPSDKTCRFAMLPKIAGIDPLKALPYADKVVSNVLVLSEEGKLPDRLLRSN